MKAVLQSRITVDEDSYADQSETEDFDDVPIYPWKFIKVLQEERDNQDGEERSVQPEELPLHVPEHIKFIRETTEESGRSLALVHL
jgi:hypothetical protein